LPVAGISPGSPGDLCNGITLTATSSTSGISYEWHYGNDPRILSNSQFMFLAVSNNPAGLYSVFVTDSNSCRSANPAVFVYTPEDQTSSYTLLAFDEINIGEFNTVENGAAGVTGDRGMIQLMRGSKVNGPGSFVKAKVILVQPSSIVLKKIFEPVDVVLPDMQYSNSQEATKTVIVPSRTTVTINGNNMNIQVRENCSVTITGNNYGRIEIGKGSEVIFTRPVLDLGELVTTGASVRSPTSIQFSAAAQDLIRVRVRKGVDIGAFGHVNDGSPASPPPDVAFYIGDSRTNPGILNINPEEPSSIRALMFRAARSWWATMHGAEPGVKQDNR